MKIVSIFSLAIVMTLISGCGADNQESGSELQVGAARWEGAFQLTRMSRTLGAAHVKGLGDDLKQGNQEVNLAKYRPDLAQDPLTFSISGYQEKDRLGAVKVTGAGSDLVRNCQIRSNESLDCPLRSQRVETEKGCQYWIALQDAVEFREGKMVYGRYYWLGPVGGKECLTKLEEELPKNAGLPLWQALFDTKVFAISSISNVDAAVIADYYHVEKL